MEMLAGPILRISCDREVEFQEPVTIQLPLWLREKPDIDLPDLSLVRARVLFQQSDGEDRGWTEITDSLEHSLSFDRAVITFSVRHFSGYAKAFVFYGSVCKIYKNLLDFASLFKYNTLDRKRQVVLYVSRG